jgi:hypothetical protein
MPLGQGNSATGRHAYSRTADRHLTTCHSTHNRAPAADQHTGAYGKANHRTADTNSRPSYSNAPAHTHRYQAGYSYPYRYAASNCYSDQHQAANGNIDCYVNAYTLRYGNRYP